MSAEVRPDAVCSGRLMEKLGDQCGYSTTIPPSSTTLETSWWYFPSVLIEIKSTPVNRNGQLSDLKKKRYSTVLL